MAVRRLSASEAKDDGRRPSPRWSWNKHSAAF